MPSLYGLLLTHTERFIAFEIDTDSSHKYVESVNQWEDVSADQGYAPRKRGTGQGFAAMALQMRRELLCGV